MADDPRVDAAATRLMVTHPSWFKRLSTVRNRKPSDAGHGDAQYAARTVAEAALRGADSLDPLRVLLADEDRAVEVMAAASWESDYGNKWTDQPEWSRDKWRTLHRAGHRAVLAALRKEASHA